MIFFITAHSPDNTFLGFVGGNGKLKQLPKKKDQAVIYGKNEEYLQVFVCLTDAAYCQKGSYERNNPETTLSRAVRLMCIIQEQGQVLQQ